MARYLYLHSRDLAQYMNNKETVKALKRWVIVRMILTPWKFLRIPGTVLKVTWKLQILTPKVEEKIDSECLIYST